MSTLGKILLWAALVGALAAGGVGYMLITKLDDTKTTLSQTETAKQAAIKDAATQKAAAEASAQAKAETDAKLTTANGKIDDLNTQLATAQKAATDAQSAVAAAKDAATAAQAKVDSINAILKGNDPQKLIDDAAAAQKAATDAVAEQKVLQDQATDLTTQVTNLKDAINRAKTGAMPGVSGKVTFVNQTWNFVVLDVGLSNGVVPNGELIVYRGKTFLGKVKVTTAEANSCVADIEPDIKGNIQVGDYVLN